jgi:DNA-binding response OmpR family regulator
MTLNMGRVVPYDKLLTFAWDRTTRGRRSCSRCTSAPAEKLERDPSAPEHIVTIRGIGYKLNR